MKVTTKQTLKNILILIAIIIVAIVIFAFDGARKDCQMQDYAKANNCTWYATGSAYGDNRDFICK
jgi:hypothetical protein